MITVDQEITIQRPVETAFAFMTNLSAFPQWQSDIVEYRQTSAGSLGVGAPGVEARQVMGQRIESTWEITTFAVNSQFGVKSTSGPLAYEIMTDFQPVAGATRLRYQFHGESKGLLKVAEPLLAGNVKKSFEESYQRLKALLESR